MASKDSGKSVWKGHCKKEYVQSKSTRETRYTTSGDRKA